VTAVAVRRPQSDPDRRIDLTAAERAVRDLIVALGRDPEREHLAQIGSWLDTHLAPRSVGVVLEAEHLCMSVRGVKAYGARTITSLFHGRLRDDAHARDEFFAHTRAGALSAPAPSPPGASTW
jgi:GTP cyclohydrolase I